MWTASYKWVNCISIKQLNWQRIWCWQRLKAEGEEGNRGWNCWWHHRCSGYEPGQTLGDDEGQGGLACCGPWGGEESDTAGQLNNNSKAVKTLAETKGAKAGTASAQIMLQMQFNKNTSATHTLALNIGPRGHYWLLILLPPNLDVTTTAPPLLKWILHYPCLLAIKMSYSKFWENVPDCLSLDHMCIPLLWEGTGKANIWPSSLL